MGFQIETRSRYLLKFDRLAWQEKQYHLTLKSHAMD